MNKNNKRMRFEYWEGELDIYEDEEDEEGVFNYCKTMAGHTLTIDARFELVSGGLPNTYIIKKKTTIKRKKE